MVMTRSKRKITQRAEDEEKRFKAQINQNHLHHHHQIHLQVKPLLPTMEREDTQKLPQPSYMVPTPHLGSSAMPKLVNKCGYLNVKTPVTTDKPLPNIHYDIRPSAKQVSSPSRNIGSPSHQSKDGHTGGFFTLKVENQPKQMKTPLPTMQQDGLQKPSDMVSSHHLRSSTMSAEQVSPSCKMESPNHQFKDAHTGGFLIQKVDNQPKQVSPPFLQYVHGSLRAKRVPCRRSSSTMTKEITTDEAADDCKSSEGTAESLQSVPVVNLDAKTLPMLQEITIGEAADLDSKSSGGTDHVPMSPSMVVESLISAPDVLEAKVSGAQALKVIEASHDIPLQKTEMTLSNAGIGGNLKRSRSLNLTETVAACEDLDDDSEVSSKSLVTVDGYKVKPELATILKDILNKYGDIAANCAKHSSISRSCLLENVCEIVQKLKKGQIMQLALIEVDIMLELLDDIESDRVVVGWLRQRVDDIKTAVELRKGYMKVKKYEAASRLVIENKEKESAELLKKLKAMEDELEMARVENKGFLSTISATRIALQQFHRKSLLADLL